MAGYTKVNLKDDVEDQAPNFGLEGKIEARMARVPLELEHQGVSYQRIAPNFRSRSGTSTKNQEEVYVSVTEQPAREARQRRDLRTTARSTPCACTKDTMRGLGAGPRGRRA